MFGQALTFYSEEFRRGTLLVKGLALIEGEDPPLIETVYRLFTIDYLTRQLAQLETIGVSSVPENAQGQPFSLDNLAAFIIASEYGAEDAAQAFSKWGTLAENNWWDDVDDSTLVTLGTKTYDDLGLLFHYRKVNSTALGTLFYLEYEELP